MDRETKEWLQQNKMAEGEIGSYMLRDQRRGERGRQTEEWVIEELVEEGEKRWREVRG